MTKSLFPVQSSSFALQYYHLNVMGYLVFVDVICLLLDIARFFEYQTENMFNSSSINSPFSYCNDYLLNRVKAYLTHSSNHARHVSNFSECIFFAIFIISFI